ncbi:hypothetical protein FVER53590_29043 [Fusarium verticillioides]|nr:hypothetical protein FVER53590_29043 [Fusarium verticillioides]
MPVTKFSTPEKYEYLNGFDSFHESESIKGALPIGANSPQKPPYGLYAEKLSGTAFTAPRHENRQTWLYRILPSASHSTYKRFSDPSSPILKAKLNYEPQQLRWDPFDIDEKVDWVRGLKLVSGAGDPTVKSGLGIYVFAAGRDMDANTAMYSSDGEMLIVAQHGVLDIQTELGRLLVRPNEIAIIPRGVRDTRLLMWWHGMESEYPYHDLLYEANHDRFYPYKYDLGRFSVIGSTSFDHPDPSIFTVLTGPSDHPGTAIADFVIFPPRWLVQEDTFRPPWYHRNTMSEFMGLICGQYDAKTGGGFQPAGASLHNIMSAHGPDADSFERASNAELKPVKIDVKACADRGITLTYAPDPVTNATADLALWLLIGSLRQLNPSLNSLRHGNFKKGAPFGRDPEGKILGILGMDCIGRALKARCDPFGITTQYHNRSELPSGKAAGARYVSFGKLVSESDIISIHVPLNAGTKHLIGAKEIDKMKDGVVIVNTARGAVIDENALAEALDSGKIGSVGLEVYEHEPMINERLLKNERALLVPHLGTHTVETLKKREMIAMENTRRAVLEEYLRTTVPEHAGI